MASRSSRIHALAPVGAAAGATPRSLPLPLLPLSLSVLLASCVTPRMPAPAHPPAPDRYELAVAPDPAARSRAAGELAFDPTPSGAVL